MTRIALFCLMTLFSVWSFADGQSRPFIEDGKTWEVGVFYGGASANNPPHTTETYYFDGDTIINNRTAKKWRCQSVGEYGTGDKLVACLLEENGKVWYIHPNTTEPKLMYDFAAGKGDTVTVCSPVMQLTKCVITSLVQTTRNGHDLKCVCFADEIDLAYPESYSTNFWMEGIGSVSSPVMNARLNVPGIYSVLMECKVNDQVLYTRKDNPAGVLNDMNAFQTTTSISSPTSEATFRNKGIYSLSGQRLSAPPSKGLYIEDGRKKVAY